jgi:hypothetical protein
MTRLRSASVVLVWCALYGQLALVVPLAFVLCAPADAPAAAEEACPHHAMHPGVACPLHAKANARTSSPSIGCADQPVYDGPLGGYAGFLIETFRFEPAVTASRAQAAVAVPTTEIRPVPPSPPPKAL